ncbi:MAG: Acetyl-CoA synthetase I (NDP forming), beta subunit [Desulfotomaculum sp. 46_296]|nr:MAG: Acetyl-CoA synthetase I (NDP forming), beta subunit [Desulfotomaculum sp. 46_296]
MDKIKSDGRKLLFEDEVKRLLALNGIAVTPCEVAHNEDQAVQLAAKFGYPSVLKVRSVFYTHKSDCGGVKLNLPDENGVRMAFREIRAAVAEQEPEACITVQPMAGAGTEVIIGVTTDNHFGKVIMFGLGGVFTEIFEDVTFRLIPITRKDAFEMLESVKGSMLLEGYRGKPPADRESLVEALLKVSKLVEDNEEIKELDLNPVVVYENGLLVLDGRGTLS